MDLLKKMRNQVLHYKDQRTIFDNRNAFYHTRAWVRTRAYILNRDGNECKTCADRGRVKVDQLLVHHIKPIEFEPDHALSYDNLITVCIACHNYIHGNAFDNSERKKRWDDEYW